MPRILDLDKFAAVSKSHYGLESGGTCYIVKNPFNLEIIESYDIDRVENPQTLKIKWAKIKTAQGDLISVTDSGCFIELQEYKGFVECRPENTNKGESPSFAAMPVGSLKKIGKDMINSLPMTFDERGKVIMSRI